MTMQCEHGHTHYSESELHACSGGRRASMDDIMNTSDDFWNMTLDDLDELTPSLHNKLERRRSDGMPPMQHRKKKSMPRRSVSFGKVEVRVCERVLGDNPACHDGPSLSIGWKYETKQQVELDTWEKKRSKERRSHDKLLLSADKREKIAKRSGFSKEEIQKNVETVAKHARRRERTRKEFEKDCMSTLVFHQAKNNHSLAKFLQERTNGRSSRGSASNSLRSMRSI